MGDTNPPKFPRTQNSFAPRDRNVGQASSVEKKPLAENLRQRIPLPAGTANIARGRPDLPVVRATRAQGYVVSRGSSKTRKQAHSNVIGVNPNPNVKTVVTTTVGPLEIIRNGPTSSKGAARTGTGASRMPFTAPNRMLEVEPVYTRSKPKAVRRVQKPKPPTQTLDPPTYAASYGAYDKNAKKKRNY